MPPQRNDDRSTLQQLIHQLGKQPGHVAFDDEDHLIELNLAGLELTMLPPEVGQFSHVRELKLGDRT